MTTKQHRKYSIDFTNHPSCTQQHQKDEVDVNKIMKRYVKTGVIDHVNKHQPNYGDTSPLNYHESMNIIANADSMFEELPSQARKNFNNDPAVFLEYVQNPKNKDKLQDMGLATRSTPPPLLVKPSEPDQPLDSPAPAAKETPT